MESNHHHDHRLGAKISRESVALLGRESYVGAKQNAFSETKPIAKQAGGNTSVGCFSVLTLNSVQPVFFLMISRDSPEPNGLHALVGSLPTEFQTNDARELFAYNFF